MVEKVHRYGVHWAPGKIAFFHQQRGGMNAVGLQEPSPFFVRTKRQWLCNHLIAQNAINPARSHLDRFAALVGRNSLVRFMLPLPKDADRDTEQGIGLFRDGDLTRIAMLMKMSSPIKMPFFFAPMVRASTVIEELEMTNTQAVVLAGVEAKHTTMVSDLVRAAASLPRRLLILAAPDVPLHVPMLDAEHLNRQDQVDLMGLPWETLGSIVLRAYMRKEWDGTWFTREPIPANEAKVRRE